MLVIKSRFWGDCLQYSNSIHWSALSIRLVIICTSIQQARGIVVRDRCSFSLGNWDFHLLAFTLRCPWESHSIRRVIDPEKAPDHFTWFYFFGAVHAKFRSFSALVSVAIILFNCLYWNSGALQNIYLSWNHADSGFTQCSLPLPRFCIRFPLTHKKHLYCPTTHPLCGACACVWCIAKRNDKALTIY